MVSGLWFMCCHIEIYLSWGLTMFQIRSSLLHPQIFLNVDSDQSNVPDNSTSSLSLSWNAISLSCAMCFLFSISIFHFLFTDVFEFWVFKFSLLSCKNLFWCKICNFSNQRKTHLAKICNARDRFSLSVYTKHIYDKWQKIRVIDNFSLDSLYNNHNFFPPVKWKDRF